MSLDLIKEGPDGQLEFDFEALEAVTSKELVVALKNALIGDPFPPVSVEVSDSGKGGIGVFVVTDRFGYYLSQRVLRSGDIKVSVQWLNLGLMRHLVKMRGE